VKKRAAKKKRKAAKKKARKARRKWKGPTASTGPKKVRKKC
jgi:hypothetical protein